MIIANALKQLFPNGNPLRDWEVRDDGDGPFIAVWNLQAAQPTLAQLQAASDAYDLAQAAQASEAQAVRAQIVTIAQSAVGVVVTNLTAAQVRSLLVVLLRKNSALDKDLKVRPLADWVD